MTFYVAFKQIFSIRIIQILFSVLTGVLTARLLGPEKIGILTLIMLSKATAFRFFNFGFGSSIGYLTSKNKIKVKDSLLLTFIVAMILSFIGSLFIYLTRETKTFPWELIPQKTFYIGLILIPIYFLENFLVRILFSNLLIRQINITEVIRIAIYTILIVILYFVKLSSVNLLLFINIFTDIIIVIMFIYFIFKKIISKRKIIKNEFSIKKDFFQYGFYNYLIMLIQFGKTSIGNFMFSFFNNTAIIGYYSQSDGLISRTEVITNPLSMLLFPFNTKSKKEDAIQRTNQLIRILIAALLLITTLSLIIIKPLILILYGKPFLPAVQFFIYLAPMIIFYPITRMLTVHMTAEGTPKFPAIINFISFALIPLLFIIFYRYGYSPLLSLCLTAGHFFNFLLLIIFYSKQYNQHFSTFLLIKKHDIISISSKIANSFQKK